MSDRLIIATNSEDISIALENHQTELELHNLKKNQIKFKVYWHWFNWNDMDDSSIILYSKETGYLAYFSDNFFSQYDKKKEIFQYDYINAYFTYLGEL